MASRLRLILILGGLTAFGPFSVDMYLPSLPAIAREFEASIAAAQATLSAFLVGLACGQLVLGPLSDRLGRRRPLLIGAAVYALMSAACALAPNIESLWAARLAQSLGACAMLVIARASVRDLYHGAEAARFFSLLLLVLGTAPIVGPQLGAFILENFGWRYVFWLLTLMGTVAFATVALGMPETLPPARRSRHGVIGSLRAYVTLLRDRRFLAPTLAADFVFAGLFAFIAGGPFVFIDLYGLSPQAFATVFSVNAFGLLVASQVNARLVLRFGPARMLTASLLVYLCAALFMTANVVTGFGGFLGIAIPLFVTFSMVGIAPTNAIALAQEHYPHAAGSAAALFGAFQFGIGALIGILTGLLHDGTAFPMAAMVVGAALLAVAVDFLLRRRTPGRGTRQGRLS